MKITNLKDSPQFIKKTLILIEEEFGYTEKNSFAIDFYPLFNKNNFENCYILVEDDKVFAHIGYKEKTFKLKNKEHQVSLYGGIVVDSKEQGRGLFKKLFQFVLEKNKDKALHFLWSDKLELYKKFNFHPAINLYHYKQQADQSSFTVEQRYILDLSTQEINSIKSLYTKNNEVRLMRSEQDWKELFNIKSTELYLIKEQDLIINYFFKGKGADLMGIIHEYGRINNKQLKVMLNYGDVWSTFHNSQYSKSSIFSSVIKVGNLNKFNELTKEMAGIEVTQIKDEVIHFLFENNEYNLKQSEFLTSLFGPARFKELEKEREFFISGLDSI